MLFYLRKTYVFRDQGGADWTYFSDFCLILGGQRAIVSFLQLKGVIGPFGIAKCTLGDAHWHHGFR